MIFINNLKFSKTLLYLIISSIIPFLIWGPFFPDLILSISALYFLFYIFKSRSFYFFNNKLLIIFFIFCCYCVLLSLFVAEDMMLSFESSLFYFRIGLFSCFIWYLIDKDKTILTYFYYSLILSFVALVIDGYIQFFTGQNIFGWPKGHHYRVSSLFGDELILGSFLSRLFPLLFALFLIKKKQKFEIYLIGFLFIFIDVLIFITGERTSFVFLNISTLFIIILIKKYKKFRIITFCTALSLIVFLGFNFSELSSRMLTKTASDMGLINVEKNSNEDNQKELTLETANFIIFSTAHDSLIRTAYKMFKDQPLFGHGPKMFRIICSNQKYQVGNKPCDIHPHNFYIQLLAETGLIGFLFLLSIFISILYISLKQFNCLILKKKKPLTDYQVCLLACILISVWPLSPNGNFFHNWLIVIYSLPIGFYLQSIYGKKKLI